MMQLATETISNTNYRFAPGANGTSAYAAANNLNQYPSVTPAGGSAQTLSYDTRGAISPATAPGLTPTTPRTAC